MTDDLWVGIHVYYHEQQDRLLRDGVMPLVTSLMHDQLVRDYFFVRHWRGGPHVRLRLRAKPCRAAPLRDLARRHIVEFLRSHPSAASMDEATFHRIAAVLTAVEREPAGVGEFRPDNHVEFAAYRPDHGWTGEPGRAVERHFAESSDITLGVIADGGSRDGIALAMMLVGTAACVPEGSSLKRHVDTASREWNDIVFGTRRPRWESEFAHRYERHRHQIVPLVASLSGPGSGKGSAGDNPMLRRWGASVSRLATALAQTDAPRVPVDRTLAYCRHLHSNRLGLSVQHEAYLLFALSRAVSEFERTRP